MDWLEDDFFDPDDVKNKDIENYIESTLKKVDEERLGDGELKFEDVFNAGNSKTNKTNDQACGLTLGEISDYVIEDTKTNVCLKRELSPKVVGNEREDFKVSNSGGKSKEIQKLDLQVDIDPNEMKVGEIMDDIETSKRIDAPMCLDESDLNFESSGPQMHTLLNQETQKTDDICSQKKKVEEVQPLNSDQERQTHDSTKKLDDPMHSDAEVSSSDIKEKEITDIDDVSVHFDENEFQVQEAKDAIGKIKDDQKIHQLKNVDTEQNDENKLKNRETTVEQTQKMDVEIPSIDNVKENEIQQLDPSSDQDKEKNIQEETEMNAEEVLLDGKNNKDHEKSHNVNTELVLNDAQMDVNTDYCDEKELWNDLTIKKETESDGENEAHFVTPGQSRLSATDVILKCIKCNDLFNSKDELLDHLRFEHSNKLIYCDLDCQHAMNAREHSSCHGDTPLFSSRNRRFFCWICGYKTKNSSNAVVHMRMHSGSKPFECSLCDFRDRTQSGVKRHEKTHSNTKKYEKTSIKREGFSCSKCDFTCSRLNALHNHAVSHFRSDFTVQHTRKPKRGHKYQCGECSYQGISSKLLRRHKMKHLFIKPHSCDACSYSTTDAYSLKLHKRKHTGEKPHFCTVCDYKCSRATTLKVHMRTHTGEKPYACIHCEYRSANNSGLKSHMMSHTGEKPYSCSFCDFRCSSSRSMKRHLMTHKTKESNLSCPICHFPGMTDTAFRKHMKTHEENKSTLVCPEFNCDFTTYNMNHLQKHLKTHENIGDFTCHICGLMCENAEYLNNHLKKVHLFQTEITLTPQKVKYACDECDFKTTNQKEFRYHGFSHSSESQLISLLNPEIKLEVVQ